MNPKLDLIFSRRSIRRYTDDDISEELVQDLLEAGMAAPSAVAKDPWHVIVVRDKATLARIASGLPNGGMLADAGVGFVICGDIDAAHDRQLSYMLQDCSAMIENILLAASALGLGACWLGVHPREDRVQHIKTLFDLAESIVPISAIAIGRPAQEAEARTRFNAAKVHMEKW